MKSRAKRHASGDGDDVEGHGAGMTRSARRPGGPATRAKRHASDDGSDVEGHLKAK
jgi:hypothetical protein